MAHQVEADRRRFDIGDIVRQHVTELEERLVLTAHQRRVLLGISRCRTAALGGHIYECPCGYELPVYNSCLDRHCPKCQGFAQEAWITDRAEQMLAVKHFHAVFTLPSELRSLAAYRPQEIYNALFSAASATLRQLAAVKYGVTLGVTMVLHTWARNMQRHPHVHAIVTAGGLSLEGASWKASHLKYLFSVKGMAKVFRAKMMHALSQMQAEGKFEGFDDFRDPHCAPRPERVPTCGDVYLVQLRTSSYPYG